jgi:protein-S-isoprenylcysteine O-methyltransferase Ste14
MTDEARALSGGAADPAGAPASLKSAVSAATGIVGLAGLAGALIIIVTTGMKSAEGALLCLAGVAVPMILWTTLVERAYRSPTVEMDFAKPRPLAETLATTRVKLVGLWATWAIIGAFYALIRHYEAPRYNFYFDLLRDAAIPLFLLSIPYVFLVDRYMLNPRDSLWQAGQWFLRFGRADWEMVKEHARCWGIKAFFIPYMFSAVRGPLGKLQGDVNLDPVGLASYVINLSVLVEIYFCTIGYILTIRPLDSHIRSANPFVAGWVAALLCYPPFVLSYRNGPLDYTSSSPGWVKALGEYDALMFIWLALLIATSAVWAWSTMIYGLRWSNLTNRGIITNGPYRYFKHPDYLAKNIRWWLLYVPFLSATGWSALQNCVLLAVMNLIYYARARTEERHLMMDPQYVAYSAWIAEHGVIPRTRRWLVRRAKALVA